MSKSPEREKRKRAIARLSDKALIALAAVGASWMVANRATNGRLALAFPDAPRALALLVNPRYAAMHTGHAALPQMQYTLPAVALGTPPAAGRADHPPPPP